MSLKTLVVFFGSAGLVFLSSFDARAQENVTAVVTPRGEIVYHSMSDRVPPSPETLKDMASILQPPSELEDAVQRNAGIKDFFASNPNLFVTTGWGDPLYSWNPNTEDLEAAAVGVRWDIAAVASEGEPLDTETFLGNLAKSLLDQTRNMACQISVRPTEIEGTVSVGIVSFSANWEIGQLCTP